MDTTTKILNPVQAAKIFNPVIGRQIPSEGGSTKPRSVLHVLNMVIVLQTVRWNFVPCVSRMESSSCIVQAIVLLIFNPV
jgi:hypothetical protein